MEEAFKIWWSAECSKSHRIIPLIISWGIWIARNKLIFDDIGCSEVEIAIKAIGLILFFIDGDHHTRVREVTVESINTEIPWGYFDGAAGGELARCGGGVVLHIDALNYVHSKAGFGFGSNNFAEICALRLLLITALEWGVHLIQVFGDSKIVIDWAA